MAPLRNTLGKSIGNLIKVGRSKDLAGSGTGGAAKDDQINSKNIGGVLILDSTATGGTKYTYSGKTIHRFTNISGCTCTYKWVIYNISFISKIF